MTVTFGPFVAKGDPVDLATYTAALTECFKQLANVKDKAGAEQELKAILEQGIKDGNIKMIFRDGTTNDE